MLLNRKIFFFQVIIFFASSLWALNCRLAERMNFPDVAENMQFWEDYSRLGSVTDQQLENLFRKHKIDLENPKVSKASQVEIQTKPHYTINNKIQKSVKALPSNLQKKFTDFISEINDKGVTALYSNPGKWRYEKLKLYDHHSIRLNDGYRVVFREVDGILEVLDVGKDATH